MKRKILMFVLVVFIVTLAAWYYAKPRIKAALNGNTLVTFKMCAGFDTFDGSYNMSDTAPKEFSNRWFNFRVMNRNIPHGGRECVLTITSKNSGKLLLEHTVRYTDVINVVQNDQIPTVA